MASCACGRKFFVAACSSSDEFQRRGFCRAYGQLVCESRGTFAQAQGGYRRRAIKPSCRCVRSNKSETWQSKTRRFKRKFSKPCRSFKICSRTAFCKFSEMKPTPNFTTRLSASLNVSATNIRFASSRETNNLPAKFCRSTITPKMKFLRKIMRTRKPIQPSRKINRRNANSTVALNCKEVLALENFPRH